MACPQKLVEAPGATIRGNTVYQELILYLLSHFSFLGYSLLQSVCNSTEKNNEQMLAYWKQNVLLSNVVKLVRSAS